MNLKRLFLIHAIVTFAAGVVLIVSPGIIPKTVGIEISPNQNLLSFLLGAAELALAYLSFYAGKIEDVKSVRLISLTFIIFHTFTAIVELLAFNQGLSAKILANVFLRILIVLLFFVYGIKKSKL
jgi:hypothetical protein